LESKEKKEKKKRGKINFNEDFENVVSSVILIFVIFHLFFWFCCFAYAGIRVGREDLGLALGEVGRVARGDGDPRAAGSTHGGDGQAQARAAARDEDMLPGNAKRGPGQPPHRKGHLRSKHQTSQKRAGKKKSRK
jgi:hypothetical protein